MYKDYYKVLMYHIFVCFISLLFISILSIPVPDLYLKEAWQIGSRDIYFGVLQIVCTILLYFFGGYYIKINTMKPYLLLITVYFCMNLWICINVQTISFTLNDPTPYPNFGGTFGAILLLVFRRLNSPLHILQWIHKYVNEYIALVILSITSVIPGVCMIIGNKLVLSRKLKKYARSSASR